METLNGNGYSTMTDKGIFRYISTIRKLKINALLGMFGIQFCPTFFGWSVEMRFR